MAKPSDERDDLVIDLSRRATWIDVWSVAILLTIVLLLSGGAYVFIYAYQFAQEDLRSEYKRSLQGLKEEEVTTTAQLNNVYQSIATHVEQFFKDKCGA